MDTQLKKIKSRFKFFAAEGGRQTITFSNCATYKNYHGHSLQTVNKK
jgi:hypothetical protein